MQQINYQLKNSWYIQSIIEYDMKVLLLIECIQLFNGEIMSHNDLLSGICEDLWCMMANWKVKWNGPGYNQWQMFRYGMLDALTGIMFVALLCWPRYEGAV